MRGLTAVLGFLLVLSVILCPPVISGEKREFVIIDKTASARVLSRPLNGSVLGRVPAGTKVEILEKRQARSGMLTQTWYRIKFKGQDGWISQYVTMGNIITEDVSTGKKVTKRAPYADKPKLAAFDENAKENFKSWTLKNTSIVWLEYQEDGLIWVRLKSSKYTSKDNVQKIADYLARAYRLQTNYKKPIVVTVWDPYKSKVWAKGRLP